MSEVRIFVCNRTYSEEWLEDMKDSNRAQYAVIEAIIDVIRDKDGGDITQAEIFEKNPVVADYVLGNDYKIIPSTGLGLHHNGAGIRHAKYSPSKHVAILWEKIRETIYITFDDHAPVRYHRAIQCISELRLGKQLGREVFPQYARNSRRFIEKLWAKGKRKNKGFDPYKRKYK